MGNYSGRFLLARDIVRCASSARQCTARCLQRVAPRNLNDSIPYIYRYKFQESAEPHVASNVRYIAFQWVRTPRISCRLLLFRSACACSRWTAGAERSYRGRGTMAMYASGTEICGSGTKMRRDGMREGLRQTKKRPAQGWTSLFHTCLIRWLEMVDCYWLPGRLLSPLLLPTTSLFSIERCAFFTLERSEPRR